MLQAKRVDTKGRISLGLNYANALVILDQNDDGDLIIKRAEIIPANEAWLFKNKKAIQSVRKGLKEAKEGKFANDAPDIDVDI